jgi:hypothetical protein
MTPKFKDYESKQST